MGQIIPFLKPRLVRPANPVRSEVVADLLQALEDAPLTDMRAAVHRRLGGTFVVVASVAEKVFELSGDEARLASHALFAEQAFVGATEASFLMMDMAEQADARTAAGRHGAA